MLYLGSAAVEAPAGHPVRGGGDRPGHQRLRAVGQPYLTEDLGSVVKLNYQIGDSFISVIPAKAGIQSLSMPQNDLPMETPEFRLSPE